MKKKLQIGFTYDLRDDYLAEGMSPEEAAEFDKPATIDAIASTLTGLGHRVARIGNLRALTGRLAAGERWDLVFNIAEGRSGFAREAQIPALLEGFGIPTVFSDALTLALCLHKGFTKRVVRDAGLATPKFVVVEEVGDLDVSGLSFPLFAKPVAEGTGKGVSVKGMVRDAMSLRTVCDSLLSRFWQPVLVEEFLPGREFTVGVVGTGAKARVLGTIEILLLSNAEPLAYTFDNKDQYLDRVKYLLVDDPESRAAADLALAAYRALGCRDGGRVDIRSDAEGKPQFMEINPLAGLDPVNSDLPIICGLKGYAFEELIGWIMDSAMERL